jgi:hypothetical protein
VHGSTARRWLLATALTWLIGGCAALPQPDVREPSVTRPPDYSDPAGRGRLYRIEEARLTLHTYRAGWLSRLAHNHVIETHEVHGAIRLDSPRNRSAGRLYFRPWDLVLDDPGARAAAGPGFESPRSPADVAATRARMLGPRGFDSNEHPFVVVDARWADETHVMLVIHFRATTLDRLVPVAWRLADNRLTASADFELTHTSLGIRPYSAFAGAIAVADPIRVRLTLSAVPADAL